MTTDATNLKMWTVYNHPSDYPDSFVARLFFLRDGEPVPTTTVIISTDLTVIRELLELGLGLYPIPRMSGDDPNIIEVWL